MTRPLPAPSEAERLVDALLSDQPAVALAGLDLADPSLREAVEVARRRLAAPSAEALALLRALSRFPGSRLADLAQHAGVDDLAAAGRELVEKGLAEGSRFGRSDCWARTAAGAALLAQQHQAQRGL